MNIQFIEFLIFLTIIALIWLWLKPNWMGFRGKSLWDWLSLLAVPALIGFATVLINAAQADIERLRQQELSVQSYIDRISELALDPRALSNPQKSTAIGRAQTTAILHVTDKERTGRVLRFLQEMGLLQQYAVTFENLDFSNAEMKGLQMDNMDFEGSNLRGSDLENGSFKNADFEEADLRYADLEDADFRGASFEEALIKGADLGRTDLRGADLSLAIGLKLSQLDDACVDETTRLPEDFNSVKAESSGCRAEQDD